METNNAREEDDLFYFESDHLALRGNVDYSELLKTMFVLEAQRIRALEDYNRVVDIKKECLKDPLSYAEKLENGSLNLPPILPITEVPNINWAKYKTNVPEQFMKQITTTNAELRNSPKYEKNTKPWTPEEQRKLEELLIKYPADVPSRKQKIANELGTRSKAQVSSRIQKYFLKLLEAGLPVPGRLPKSKGKYLNKIKKQQTTNGKYLKPTTFFPDTIIPVTMDESEHAPGPSMNSYPAEISSQVASPQSNYLLSNNYQYDKQTKVFDKDIEVDLLKWVKEEKLYESQQNNLYKHYGYKCDYCEDEPIQGSRWHCTACIKDCIDFCTDCILSQYYSRTPHNVQHKFMIIRSDIQVLNGPWSESDSDSDTDDDSNSKDNQEEDDESSSTGQQEDEECSNDTCESTYTNGES